MIRNGEHHDNRYEDGPCEAQCDECGEPLGSAELAEVVRICECCGESEERHLIIHQNCFDPGAHRIA